MKRRFAALVLAMAAVLSLSGCGLFGGDGQQTPETPRPSSRVYPAELTESEMGLLDLFGTDADGWKLYDFLAPEGTLYVSLTLWELADGEWEALSSDSVSTAVSDGQGGYDGRIAVRFDLDTRELEYACQMNSGTMRHDPLVLGEDAEEVSWGVSSLSGGTTAEADTPIALLLISASDGDSHTQYVPQIGFDGPELFDGSHVHDYAVTIEFVSALAYSHESE